MFGGGHRKDDGLPAVSTANIFSALERKSSKKKADKHALHIGDGKTQQEDVGQFWVPSPVTVKSWADVEDDDDYFATTAPPPAIWGQTKTKAQESSVNDALSHLEESEGEDDIDDDGEEEVDEEKSEPAVVVSSGQAEERPQTPSVLRDVDKQLSKKEIKKKELAELDAVLAEFGVPTENRKDKSELDDESVPSGDADTNNETEKKSSKKKKPKKDKTTPAPSGPVIMEEIESNVTAVTEPMDVLIKKKLVAVKKKKSVKENTATSKVAAEAAARAARLAAAKKKEKTHYNQQPAR